MAAQAEAGPWGAQASVSCSNPASCDRYYEAGTSIAVSWIHQQQTLTLDEITAHATKTGTCSGSSGSGCGVLKAGGGLQCTGDCSNYSESVHDVTYEVTKLAVCTTNPAACQPPSMGGANGEPIHVKDMGEKDSGAEAGFLAPDGTFVPFGQEAPPGSVPAVQRKESGKPAEAPVACTGPCQVGDGRSGPYASYDPAAAHKFYVSNSFDATDLRRDEAASDTHALTVRDAAGNGVQTFQGAGYSVNGRTGARITALSAPATRVHETRLSDAHGSPFTFRTDSGALAEPGVYEFLGARTDISGEPIPLPPNAKPRLDATGNPITRDRLTFTGSWAEITDRAGADFRGTFKIRGYGEWISREGDRVPLRSGEAEIVTRGLDGYGGHMTIKAEAPTYALGIAFRPAPSNQLYDFGLHTPGEEKTRDNSIASGIIEPLEGGFLACEGCTGDGTTTGYATHFNPTAPGKGGVNGCAGTGGRCTGRGANWDNKNGARSFDEVLGEVPASATGKGHSFGFVQWLRNVDGSGGEAVAFATGAGLVKAHDAYGKWIEDRTAPGLPDAGIYLGFSEADGYNDGQACANPTGGCRGSAPVHPTPGKTGEHLRLTWIEP
ncbi:MAG: hypothetical protein ACRDQ0_11240, partial [Pseudonocardia sp.]